MCNMTKREGRIPTVILHKRGGTRCEILWKMSENAGTPPNIHVKIEFFKIVKIEFLKIVS